MRRILKGASVYIDGRFKRADIAVENTTVTEIGQGLNGDEHTDLSGMRIIPGLIDIHTHGGYGVDINRADAAQILELNRQFTKNGVTGWLASILTDTRENTARVIREIVSAMENGADALLGIHLEGPFLSAEYRGAMPEHLLMNPDFELFEKYLQISKNHVRYITVSPELKGARDFIRKASRYAAVSIGHSGACYDDAMRAIDAGASACTHICNAMRLLHQHEPAIMGAALETDIYCEVICDGRHLHPGTVRLVWKIKPEKFVAVTDSLQPAGMPDGEYTQGANAITVRDGDAKIKGTDIRAGSTLTGFNGLKNLMKFTGAPLERALIAFTKNPAELIGVLGKKGVIKPGADADLLIIDDEMNLCGVIAKGVKIEN